MTTADDVRTLLRDAARDYPTVPPPTRLVIDRGRRAKSRRLAWVAGGAAASVIVLAVVAGVAGHVDTGSGRIGPTRGHDDLNSDQASTMPMLIGLTRTDAGDAMSAMNGRYGTGWTTEVATTSCDKVGLVIAQDPAPRAAVTAAVIDNMSITVGKASGSFACDDVPPADRQVAQAFAAFADDLQAHRMPIADAPFAPKVALGLGNEFRKTISRDQVTDSNAWGIQFHGYATAHGTSIVPYEIDAQIDFMHVTTDLEPTACTVTLSDAPSTTLTRGGHPLRIYNGSPQSCWDDTLLDLYIDDHGQIVGVNLILGAPEDMQ